MLCHDVLVDVCRFLTRQQLANSVALLSRQCWLGLFQPDNPFHTYPCHVVDELDFSMDDYFDGNCYKEAFFVAIFSDGSNRHRTDLLRLDDEDDRPTLALDAVMAPPSWVRFKLVRVQLRALLDYQGIPNLSHQEEEEEDEEFEPEQYETTPFTYIVESDSISTDSSSTATRLDHRKLELLDLLSSVNFRGASLLFNYNFAPFHDRPGCSAFLSDKFFARFFDIFEVIKFRGPSLPIKSVPIEQQPLLLLPGLVRNKKQLVFEGDYSDFMFEAGEIAEWLHSDNTGTERILFISGIGFPSMMGHFMDPRAEHWAENLVMELKKHLQCASKIQPYTLFICGPICDAMKGSPTSPPAVLARNYDTCEQLIQHVHDPRHDKLPSGAELGGGFDIFRAKCFFIVYRRTTMA